MLRVTVDNEVPIEDVIGYSMPGGRMLVLEFKDGSTRGICLGPGNEFVIEREDNPQVGPAPNVYVR